MKIRVRIAERGQQSWSQDLDVAELTIGRVKGNDLVLARGNVSKRHARVVSKGSALVLVDLKSTNGTYVNGHKLSSPHLLKPEDKVYIGDFTLSFARPPVDEPTAAGRTPLPAAAPPGAPAPRTPLPRSQPPRTPTPRPPTSRTPLPAAPSPSSPAPPPSPPRPPPLPAAEEDEDGAEFFAPVEDAVDDGFLALRTAAVHAVARSLESAWARADAGADVAGVARDRIATPRGTRSLTVVVVLGSVHDAPAG